MRTPMLLAIAVLGLACLGHAETDQNLVRRIVSAQNGRVAWTNRSNDIMMVEASPANGGILHAALRRAGINVRYIAPGKTRSKAYRTVESQIAEERQRKTELLHFFKPTATDVRQSEKQLTRLKWRLSQEPKTASVIRMVVSLRFATTI